jgi:hypothetical protein
LYVVDQPIGFLGLDNGGRYAAEQKLGLLVLRKASPFGNPRVRQQRMPL